MQNKDKIKEVLARIAHDAECDATNLDNRPFNGREVGEMFGNVLASIQALAKIIDAMLPDELPTSGK